MTKVLLVRHGEVPGINPKRFRGRDDLPLTDRGRAEAGVTARRIADGWEPARVYTSPLARCVATGAMIARACRIGAEPLGDLVDIDYGAWQSKSYDEIEVADPERYWQWLKTPQFTRFPGGDSLQDLIARSADALRLVLERHPRETIVLVAHDSVNRALLLQLLDQPVSAYWRLAQSPCCINEMDVSDGRVEVRRLNETYHLDGLETSA